jgi:hypothetical protein
MSEIAWGLTLCYAASGVVMALVSALVGMKPRLENPLWWLLYALWIAAALLLGVEAVFRTVLAGSILAGFLHGATLALLLDRYRENNPWHAEKMQGSRGKLAAQLVAIGLVVGTLFGAVVAALAYGLARI